MKDTPCQDVLSQATAQIERGKTLTRNESSELIRAMVETQGHADTVERALRALHQRGETSEEILGAVDALRRLAIPLPQAPTGSIDTCGTGGDHSGSFNISTTAALVVAATGVPVAKHGNRSATSLCGSADVLEALGVRIDIPPEVAAQTLFDIGITFLYARHCHPAMASVAQLRRKIEHPTIFNRLGPLTNPMGVKRQLLGVANAERVRQTAKLITQLSLEKAWVVRGNDGLDELSLFDKTSVWEVIHERVQQFDIDPRQFFAKPAPNALQGGDAHQNADIVRGVIRGTPGPPRDVVLLNAAAAMVVADRVDDVAQGIDRAAQAIDSGAVEDLLQQWITRTNSYPINRHEQTRSA